MRILLGNAAPREVHHHDSANPAHAGLPGNLDTMPGYRVVDLDPTVSNQTEVLVPAGEKLGHVARTVEDLWRFHSHDEAPSRVLVDGDETGLAQAFLAEHFGIPTPDGPTALVTNAGLDYAAAQLGGTASATAVAQWIALTANSTAPAATDTTLTGEITTAGGGLVRAQATYAHTTGATTYTLSKTFTANSSDALPVTVAKIGVFTASSAGSLVFETALSPTATLSASGDTVSVTETVTV